MMNSSTIFRVPPFHRPLQPVPETDYNASQLFYDDEDGASQDGSDGSDDSLRHVGTLEDAYGGSRVATRKPFAYDDPNKWLEDLDQYCEEDEIGNDSRRQPGGRVKLVSKREYDGVSPRRRRRILRQLRRRPRQRLKERADDMGTIGGTEYEVAYDEEHKVFHLEERSAAAAAAAAAAASGVEQSVQQKQHSSPTTHEVLRPGAVRVGWRGQSLDAVARFHGNSRADLDEITGTAADAGTRAAADERRETKVGAARRGGARGEGEGGRGRSGGRWDFEMKETAPDQTKRGWGRAVPWAATVYGDDGDDDGHNANRVRAYNTSDDDDDDDGRTSQASGSTGLSSRGGSSSVMSAANPSLEGNTTIMSSLGHRSLKKQREKKRGKRRGRSVPKSSLRKKKAAQPGRGSSRFGTPGSSVSGGDSSSISSISRRAGSSISSGGSHLRGDGGDDDSNDDNGDGGAASPSGSKGSGSRRLAGSARKAHKQSSWIKKLHLSSSASFGDSSSSSSSSSFDHQESSSPQPRGAPGVLLLPGMEIEVEDQDGIWEAAVILAVRSEITPEKLDKNAFNANLSMVNPVGLVVDAKFAADGEVQDGVERKYLRLLRPPPMADATFASVAGGNETAANMTLLQNDPEAWAEQTMPGIGCAVEVEDEDGQGWERAVVLAIHHSGAGNIIDGGGTAAKKTKNKSGKQSSRGAKRYSDDSDSDHSDSDDDSDDDSDHDDSEAVTFDVKYDADGEVERGIPWRHVRRVAPALPTTAGKKKIGDGRTTGGLGMGADGDGPPLKAGTRVEVQDEGGEWERATVVSVEKSGEKKKKDDDDENESDSSEDNEDGWKGKETKTNNSGAVVSVAVKYDEDGEVEEGVELGRVRRLVFGAVAAAAAAAAEAEAAEKEAARVTVTMVSTAALTLARPASSGCFGGRSSSKLKPQRGHAVLALGPSFRPSSYRTGAMRDLARPMVEWAEEQASAAAAAAAAAATASKGRAAKTTKSRPLGKTFEPAAARSSAAGGGKGPNSEAVVLQVGVNVDTGSGSGGRGGGGRRRKKTSSTDFRGVGYGAALLHSGGIVKVPWGERNVTIQLYASESEASRALHSATGLDILGGGGDGQATTGDGSAAADEEEDETRGRGKRTKTKRSPKDGKSKKKKKNTTKSKPPKAVGKCVVRVKFA